MGEVEESLYCAHFKPSRLNLSHVASSLPLPGLPSHHAPILT